MKAKRGDIGLSNNLKGFFPAAIRFFTGSHISHSFLVGDSWLGHRAVIEAGNLVQVVPWKKFYVDKPTEEYWVYRIHDGKVKEQDMVIALSRCFNNYAGKTYGYLQLLWFIWRWAASKFGMDVRRCRNWLPGGVICSELVYWYLFYLGGEFRKLIEPFTSNTIQAHDIYEIIQSRPDLFYLVEEKTKDVA